MWNKCRTQLGETPEPSLPAERQRVLLTDGRDVFVGYLFYTDATSRSEGIYRWNCDADESDSLNWFDVTHWAPLPELPRGPSL